MPRLQEGQVLVAIAVEQIIQNQPVYGSADREGEKGDIGLNAYWRRADGGIALVDGGPNGMQVYPKKKWTYLGEYGQWSLTRQGNWDPMNNPYQKILERGGVKEFSLDQIVELNWHRKPHPVLKRQMDALITAGVTEEAAFVAVMPQLKGFTREDFLCPNSSCRGRVFNTQGDLNAHEIIHKQDVQTRQLGEAITKATMAGQAASAETMSEALSAIAQVVQSLAVSQQDMQKNFAALLANVAKQNTSGK